MEPDRFDPSPLFFNVAAQLRLALANLHLAAARLVPPDAREREPQLDADAALLDQSYYQLLRLVNNLTMAGKLTQPEHLPLRDQNLVSVARELCEKVQEPAELLGIRLEFRSAESYHLCAIHRPSIEQLLYQLLSNALKFTPAGGTVTVEVKAADRRIRLSVADTGCGIGEEDLSHLFDRFVRTDQPGRAQGLGLGLIICQHIAESHGGSLVAESRAGCGCGSRFTLSLPDRRCGNVDVSDVKFDYSGGFNPTLLALADALPPRAFSHRHMD